MIAKDGSIKRLIDEVTNLSQGGLKTKNDFERLITLALKEDNLDELEDLAFQAKYLTGLLKIIQSNSEFSDDQYKKKLALELQVTYTNIQKKISIILQKGTKFIQKIFEEKYLKLSQESLANLSELSYDLSILKLYLNDLKQKKDSE